MKPMLIYLHGLNSSSLSTKAVQTIEYSQNNRLDLDLWIPDLNTCPSDMAQNLQNCLIQYINLRDISMIGSSLGGFMGTWLQNWLLDHGHKKRHRLVLINPVVYYRGIFDKFLGPQKNPYTGTEWILTEKHINQLQPLDIKQVVSPENTLLLVQTGDEVLDYRLAVKRYALCRQIIQDGGNHAFEHFEKTLPIVFDFLFQSTIRSV